MFGPGRMMRLLVGREGAAGGRSGLRGVMLAALLALASPGAVLGQEAAGSGGSTTANDGAVVSGGAAPGQPAVKVQADNSGTLTPEKQRAPAPAAGGAAASGDLPASGGFAPQTKPKTVASGGASSGALDYQGWERLATRAESAITNTSLSNTALENLRGELTRWREQLQGAQSANSTRIATLKDQIDALGPLPADGATEEPEIASRRAELNAQMGRLQAPGIAADEAYRRADGLIREIDRVVRERQANELLKLWPSPVNPVNWSDALAAVSQTAATLWGETSGRLMDARLRARMVDALPLILPLLVFAIAALGRGRHWTERLVLALQGAKSWRGRRIWSFIASLGLIVVPLLGLMALSQALQQSGMLGLAGQQINTMLVPAGGAWLTALWLGARVFPAEDNPGLFSELAAERRAEGRFLTGCFGLLLAVATLRRAAMSEIDASDAATSVLNFPFILIGGLLLVRLAQVIRQALYFPPEEGKANYRATLGATLTRTVFFFGAVGPVLAAVGYNSAANAVVFPTAMTLGVAALVALVQRLVGDLYTLVMRADGASEQDALAPVLIGFALTLATLPLVALIWGARISDLTELWTRFQEGFQLGATRISPTDFLFFAVVFAIGWSLTRVLQGAMKTSILPRTGLDNGAQNAIVSGLGYVGIMVSALVAIDSTGIDLSGLAIVAGALSVGIGFGLQNIVSNFVSGIILLIERPVSEGDWIEVGTVQGTVKAISVRSTRIQTFDRADVIVPNSDLISGRVTNWTRFSLTGRLIVPVTVPYTEDSRRVAKILTEIAEAQPLVLLSPPPMVAFMGFAAETMSFEIRVILRDVNFQLNVRTEINHQIAARFAAEKIPFTSAHRDFLKRGADDAAAEVKALAEEAGHIAAVEAILGTRLPPAARALAGGALPSPSPAPLAASATTGPGRLDPDTTDAIPPPQEP